MIQMIQNTLQFKGNIVEEPNQHLKQLLKLCDTFKYKWVSDDAVRLWLFPFSLCENESDLPDLLESDSITMWNDLAEKFSIIFSQKVEPFSSGQSLYKAWEHFKTMLVKCPHHELQAWHQIQIFYNGDDDNIRSSLDGAASGSLMFHTYERAYKIIDNITMNSYMWPNERFIYKSKPTTIKAVNMIDINEY